MLQQLIDNAFSEAPTVMILVIALWLFFKGFKSSSEKQHHQTRETISNLDTKVDGAVERINTHETKIAVLQSEIKHSGACGMKDAGEGI